MTMTNRQRAKVIVRAMNVPTDSYSQAVNIVEEEIERAAAEAVEAAVKSTLAECIDRIGGDTYNGTALTADELRQQFWDTYRSLEQREIEIEREACAAIADARNDAIANDIRARSKATK